MFGMQVRNWFLASPVDEEHFIAYVAIQSKRDTPLPKGRLSLRRHVGLLRDRVIDRLLSYEASKEFAKDVVIWDRRRYLETPMLCASDGPLHKFRSYCSQFYPEMVEDNASAVEPS